jgi:hypothetical protein
MRLLKMLPVLDPPPSGKPHDYSLRRMRAPVPVEVVVSPESWTNPYENEVADADQDFRGTCTGQATRYWSDFNYIELTGDKPSPEERSHYQKDVIDPIGTRHDVLFDNSFSAECSYQMGRFVGNITYPSGGEIRFNARALRDYGICLEEDWHTDKAGTMVWTYPPGARGPTAGGATPEEAATFSAFHRVKGWAMVGREDGDATWDEIRAAINKYKKILCGIPIYENYQAMAGGDGTYPTPRGPIVGYHAQCVYGHTPDYLKLKHSWGSWCGVNGKLTKEYFDIARDQSVWMVIIDEEESKILHDLYTSISITSNVVSIITVDGVVIGPTPQRIALEKGRQYTITATAEGYIAQTKTVDESSGDIQFVLEPSVPLPQTWWQRLIDWLINLFKRN